MPVAEDANETGQSSASELAVHTRAAELSKANNALQDTIDAVAEITSLDELVPRVLTIIATTYGAHSCAIYRNEPSGRIYLQYWFVDGRTMLPHELLELDPTRFQLVRRLAEGFEVPDDYLGKPPQHALGAVLLDHARGTSVPAFDAFAVEAGFDLELNVGVAAQGIRAFTLCIYRRWNNPFSEQEVTLSEALAKQIALAMETSRLAMSCRDTAVALEREAAAQQQIALLRQSNDALRRSVERASQSGRFDSLLEGLLLESMAVMGAAGGGITLWHQGQFAGHQCIAQDGQVVAREQWQQEPFFRETAAVLSRDPDGFTHRLLAADYTCESLDWAKQHWPAAAAYHGERGHVEVWNVPCISKGSLIASLGLAFREPQRPSPVLLSTLTTLAQQIALMLEMANLAEEAQEAAAARGRETQARRMNNFLVHTASGLSGSPDLSAALESLLSELARALDACHLFLFRHNSATRSLRLQVSYLDGHLRWGPNGEELALWEDSFPDDITPAWQIMCRQRGLFTPTMTPIPADDFAWPGAIDYIQRFHLSDVGHVVLFAGDVPVGSLGLGFRGGKQLQPTDKPFVEAAAQQAAIAIRMLDLAEEAKQAAIAREREEAAQERASELAKANAALRRGVERLSEAQDIEAILGSFLLEAIAASGAISGAVFTTSDQSTASRCRAVATCAGLLSGDSLPAWTKLYPAKSAADPLGIVHQILSQGFMTVPLDSEALWAWFPELAEFHFALGHKFAWNMTIRSGSRTMGFLGLAFAERKEPTPTARETLETLTQQTALALEVTRLADETRQAAVLFERENAAQLRLKEIVKTTDALKQTLDVMAFEPDLNKVLGHVLVAITKQLDSPSSALWLAQKSSPTFNVHLTYHEGQVSHCKRGDNRLIAMGWGASDLLLKTHIDDRRPVVYQVGSLKHSNPIACAFFQMLGIHTLLGIPLLLSSEIVGSITIRFDKPRVLTAEQLELAQAMAHQVTMAIQLTSLAQRAGEAALIEERMRFSRDVHDTLAQGFTGILLQLGAASQVRDDRIQSIESHLQAIGELARFSLAEARRSVRALRTTPVSSESLARIVERLVDAVRTQTKAEVVFRIEGPPMFLSPLVESEIGRIVQEALHNCVKHACAEHISVSLDFQGNGASRIAVKDDGDGFDSAQKPAYGSFGLLGMQERAASIGASLTVVSEKGRGTQIILQYTQASRR